MTQHPDAARGGAADASIFNLHRLVHKALIHRLRRLVVPHDFNHGELPILARLIKEGDGVSQKDIRTHLPICKSTLSKTVDSLTRKGYLRKERDPDDRRSTLIYLTEKGKNVGSLIREIDEEVETVLLNGFSEHERKALAVSLERMLANLRQSDE